MLPEHAQMADGSTSVEASLADWTTRMETSRFRVFDHLSGFWDAYRIYHRKDGRIVKEADHVLDATRYALMSLRNGATGAEPRHRRVTQADDVDFDVFDPSRESSGGRRGSSYRPDYFSRPILPNSLRYKRNRNDDDE